MSRSRRGAPRLSAVTAIIVAGGGAALLAAGPAAARMFDPKSFMLDNGMQVVLVENHRAPAVIQMVWYKTGSADEQRGKSGIAHFLEHLMFKGTPTVPVGQFSRIVAQNGGRDNAFTSNDYTGYYQVISADRLELVMRMEADRMANLAIPEAEVPPEREVIIEERRMRTDNQPTAQLYEMMQAAQFLHHPYRIPVIGWESEMRGLTHADAVDWYQRHYAPNNAILVVAGDVTMETLKPLAEKYYGTVARRDVPPRDRVQEPPSLAARKLTMESEQVRQPTWRRSYLAPSYGIDKGPMPYALQLLMEILAGDSGRLEESMVLKQGIATSVSGYYGAEAIDLGTFVLQATPRPGKTLETVEAEIDKQIARIIADGVTQGELVAAQKRMKAAAVYARDSLETGARILGTALAAGRTIEDVESWPDRIAEVTVPQISEAAKLVFVPRNSVTGYLLPKPAQTAAVEPPKAEPAKAEPAKAPTTPPTAKPAAPVKGARP